MGWVTPINLGSEGTKLELKANGTDGYQCYQINTSGNLEASTKEGLNYYIENRQLTGWDVGLPSHGLLIWKVNFSSSAWKNNSPNNTANNPRYTVLSASGTGIGTHVNSAGSAYIYDGPKNVYPGEAKVTEKEVVTGKPLKDIKESNGVISLVYIDEPAGDPFDLVWMSNGEEFAVTPAIIPAAYADVEGVSDEDKESAGESVGTMKGTKASSDDGDGGDGGDGDSIINELGGTSGGCDAGFGALALALAATMIFVRKRS